jgi:hypothetical protein
MMAGRAATQGRWLNHYLTELSFAEPAAGVNRKLLQAQAVAQAAANAAASGNGKPEL